MSSNNMSVSTVNFGFFRLDGGAMFGSVPKNLWSKVISCDDENCIPLASRSLLIRDGARTILVDVGLGDKWNEKSRAIFGIKNFTFAELGIRPEDITDVILTHLHFDHAGGISKYTDQGELKATFPNAKVYVQKSNYENAKSPSLRERASYLTENVSVLSQVELVLVDGLVEVLPGIKVHRVDGHTVGQQWVEVITERDLYMFATDLIPTSRHLPLPYTMGYDICCSSVMREKAEFLEYAVSKNAIVVFQHDPDTAAARVCLNEKGHFAVKEKVLV